MSVDGIPLDFNTEFMFLSPHTFNMPKAPKAGAMVEVRRITPSDKRLVDFIDGSVLQEFELDLANVQLLFLIQEALDGLNDTLSYNRLKDSWDAGGKRITGVGNATDDSDAVNRQLLNETTAAIELLINNVNNRLAELSLHCAKKRAELKEYIDASSVACAKKHEELKDYTDASASACAKVSDAANSTLRKELTELYYSIYKDISESGQVPVITLHNKLGGLQGGFTEKNQNMEHHHSSAHMFESFFSWVHAHGGYPSTDYSKYPKQRVFGGMVSDAANLETPANIYHGGTPDSRCSVYSQPSPQGFIKGMIVMWRGTPDSVPNGWVLCNGLNGAPNLSDKFVVGEGVPFHYDMAHIIKL